MSYSASNLKEAISKLETALLNYGPAIRVERGKASSAPMSGLPRIVLVRKKRSHEQPHEQPIEGNAVAQKNIRFDAMLYAADDDALDHLCDQFIDGLDEAFSRNGCNYDGAGDYGDSAPDRAGFSLSVPLTLFFPVLRERWIPGHIDTVFEDGFVSGAAAESPEAL